MEFNCNVKRWGPEWSYRREFTLIELLVVIAIISILPGLLLPALRASMESARQTECANTIKQVYLGNMQYQEDFSDWMPVLNTRRPKCWFDAGYVYDMSYFREVWPDEVRSCPTVLPDASPGAGFTPMSTQNIHTVFGVPRPQFASGLTGLWFKV